MNLSQKQFEIVLDEVLGYVNGCPEAAIRSATSLLVREYVHDIGGLPFWCACVHRVGGELHVDAPFGGIVSHVARVMCHGEPVNPQAYRSVAGVPDCRIVFRDGIHHHDISVHGYWEPTVFTKELPHDDFVRHAGAICNGVAAKLLTQEGKPWADLAIGAQFLARYQEDIRNALYERRAAEMEGGRIDMLDRQEPFIY